jgi:hypothetical protein
MAVVLSHALNRLVKERNLSQRKSFTDAKGQRAYIDKHQGVLYQQQADNNQLLCPTYAQLEAKVEAMARPMFGVDFTQNQITATKKVANSMKGLLLVVLPCGGRGVMWPSLSFQSSIKEVGGVHQLDGALNANNTASQNALTCPVGAHKTPASEVFAESEKTGYFHAVEKCACFRGT